MKKIISLIMVAMLAFPMMLSAQNESVNNEQPSKKEQIKAAFKIISNDSLTEEQKRDSIISLGIDIAEAKGVLEGISLDDTIAGNNANADKDYGNFESGYYNDGDESFDIVGLAAVTIPFITAIVIVLIVLYFNYKKRVARYNLINTAIENNYPIPESLLSDKKPSAPADVRPGQQTNATPSDWSEMRSSATLAIVGFVLWIAFGWDSFVGKICLIPMAIGLVRLGVTYYQIKHRTPEVPETSEQNRTPEPPEIPGNNNSDNNN